MTFKIHVTVKFNFLGRFALTIMLGLKVTSRSSIDEYQKGQEKKSFDGKHGDLKWNPLCQVSKGLLTKKAEIMSTFYPIS